MSEQTLCREICRGFPDPATLTFDVAETLLCGCPPNHCYSFADKRDNHPTETLVGLLTNDQADGRTFLDFPFPLKRGGFGLLRLPVGLDESERDRLCEYVRLIATGEDKP